MFQFQQSYFQKRFETNSKLVLDMRIQSFIAKMNKSNWSDLDIFTCSAQIAFGYNQRRFHKNYHNCKKNIKVETLK